MRTHQAGTSLLELTFVLLLCGIATAMTVPLARRSLDGLAVRAARDELVAALVRTRAAAMSRGGATLEIDAASGTLRIRDAAGRQVGDVVALGARHRVTLDVGAAGAAAIRYDALGIGRLANRTVRLRRGGAEAVLTLSAYGRWRAS